MLIGLKIDIFTREGLQENLPDLLKLLDEYKLQATFFPALGPDPGRDEGLFRSLFGKAPDLDIETKYAFLNIMERGHELGAVPYDVAKWREQVLERDAAWTRKQLQSGVQAFVEQFIDRPRVVAVPDFLINADTPLLEEELGFDYACDSRGIGPYLPVSTAGPSRCPQIPVTLPRIEEAVAAGQPLEDVHQYLFMESQKLLPGGHLFNFTVGDAAHLQVLEKLIVMWKGSERELVPVQRLFEQLTREEIPQHHAGLIQLGEDRPQYAAQGDPVEPAS